MESVVVNEVSAYWGGGTLGVGVAVYEVSAYWGGGTLGVGVAVQGR